MNTGFKGIVEKTVSTNNFTFVIRILASLLLTVILIGFVGGIVKTFVDLQLLIHQSLEGALRQMLLNVLILLAIIEVIRTCLGYLIEGRVRVTYIVDTVLIVMLNEVVAFWYKGDHDGYIPLLAVLVTLMGLRILAIKYSPNLYGDDE